MTARAYSAEAKALMLELVQTHTARKVEAIMAKQMPGQVPGYNVIRNARAAYLISVSVASMRDLPARRALIGPMPIPVKRTPRAPLTFEEKMARVAAGAGLVTVHPMRKAAPSYTLGGVASASL